jgi:hypothetical protein
MILRRIEKGERQGCACSWKWILLLAFTVRNCPSAAWLDHPSSQLSQGGDLKKQGELVR